MSYANVMSVAGHSSDSDVRPARAAQSDARFLIVFRAYVQPGEWVTAAELTERLIPSARLYPSKASLVKREVSQKLSNLNRFGHLERRFAGFAFEYAVPVK